MVRKLKNIAGILVFLFCFVSPLASKAQTAACQPSKAADFKARVLRQGDKSNDVGALQEAINNAGGNVITVDCDFGPDTKRAVENIQRANDLTVDGVAGANTFRVLGLPVVDTGAGTGTGAGAGAGGASSANCGGDPKLELRDGLCQPKVTCTAGSLTCVNSLSDLLALVVKYLLMFAGVIAVLFIVLGGFWYITSAGNEEQAEKGQKALTNAVIGLVVVIMSYVLVTIIANALSGNTGL